jgi:hypothetical protein
MQSSRWQKEAKLPEKELLEYFKDTETPQLSPAGDNLPWRRSG